MNTLGETELLLICFVVLIFAVVILIPYWKIFGKAGFSPWLCLLMVVPLVNIVMLYFLGFSDWPSHREKKAQN